MYIPAFQFAMNITPHSAIGCSPFEAGHGVPATTISNARLMADRYQHNHLEGQDDGDVIEDNNSEELQGQVKNLIELAKKEALKHRGWVAVARQGRWFAAVLEGTNKIELWALSGWTNIFRQKHYNAVYNKTLFQPQTLLVIPINSLHYCNDKTRVAQLI